MVVVNNNTELNSEIASATGGEVIELADGVTFGTVDVNGKSYSSEVTIQAENSANKNNVGRIRVRGGSSNVRIKNLISKYDGLGGFDQYSWCFLQSSSNTILDGCVIYTDLTTSPNNAETGFLVSLASMSNSEVINCEIYNYMFGIYCLDGRVINIENNYIHDGRSDRIHYVRTDDMTVHRNHLGANNTVRGDHADMLQCARGPANNQRRSDRQRITENVFDQGNGDWSQTIHMGGDGADGPTFTHDDVYIRNNIIYGGHQNAMNLFNIDNADIQYNTVITTPSGVTYEPNPGVINEPRINISAIEAGATGTVSNNVSESFVIPAGWTQTNNIQSQRSDYANHYNILAEAPTPDDYNDLEYKSGGAVHTALAGSRMMAYEGGWPGGTNNVGIAPNSTYPGGFTGAGAGSPPVVSSLSPADNATDRPISTQPTATFDKLMQVGTGDILIRKNGATVETLTMPGDIGTGAGSVEISGVDVIIHPTSLDAGATYSFQIANGALEDTTGAAFAGIADDTTWNFDTLSAPPSIPSNGQVTIDLTVG